MRQTDDGRILHLIVGTEEILDLYGIQILTAGDDDVLLTVHQIDESVLVLLGHIAGQEPIAPHNLGGSLGILVVAAHDAGAAYGQFAYLATGHVAEMLVHDAGLPAKSSLADGTHVIDVLHAQMHAAGADGLGQTVVGVVLVMGENILPAADQTGRYGLCTDVHQTPAIQAVFAQIDISPVNGIQNILGPRHQKPYDGGLFAGGTFDDPLRLHAPQKNGPGSAEQTAEPVHLSTGVIQGRNTEEHVGVALSVMCLLRFAGGHESRVTVQNRLGEAGSTGGEINGGVVRVGNLHRRGHGGAVMDHRGIMIGVRGRFGFLTHEEPVMDQGDLILHLADAGDELRSEDHHGAVRQIGAVADLLGAVAVVHGHGQGAGLQNTEIDGQPLQAVHEQDRYPIAPADAAGEKEIGKTVGVLVKGSPRHLTAVFLALGCLDQAVFVPGQLLLRLVLGRDLRQGDLAGVESGVSFQEIGDWHNGFS